MCAFLKLLSIDTTYMYADLLFFLTNTDVQEIQIQSTLDISNSDISNSAKLEASFLIKNTFWLLSPTMLWRWSNSASHQARKML